MTLNPLARSRHRRDEPPPITQWRRYRIFILITLTLYCVRFGLVYTPLLSRDIRVPRAFEWITVFFGEPSGWWRPVYAIGIIWFLIAITALIALVVDQVHNVAFLAAVSFTLYLAAAYVVDQIKDNPPYMASFATAIFLVIAAMLVSYGGLTSRPGTAPDGEPDDVPDVS